MNRKKYDKCDRKIKIISGGSGIDTKVFYKGVSIPYIKSISVNVTADGYNKATIEFLLPDIEMDVLLKGVKIIKKIEEDIKKDKRKDK